MICCRSETFHLSWGCLCLSSVDAWCLCVCMCTWAGPLLQNAGATQPLAQGLAGFDENYAETSVPEKRGYACVCRRLCAYTRVCAYTCVHIRVCVCVCARVWNMRAVACVRVGACVCVARAPNVCTECVRLINPGHAGRCGAERTDAHSTAPRSRPAGTSCPPACAMAPVTALARARVRYCRCSPARSHSPLPATHPCRSLARSLLALAGASPARSAHLKPSCCRQVGAKMNGASERVRERARARGERNGRSRVSASHAGSCLDARPLRSALSLCSVARASAT